MFIKSARRPHCLDPERCAGSSLTPLRSLQIRDVKQAQDFRQFVLAVFVVVLTTALRFGRGRCMYWLKASSSTPLRSLHI